MLKKMDFIFTIQLLPRKGVIGGTRKAHKMSRSPYFRYIYYIRLYLSLYYIRQFILLFKVCLVGLVYLIVT